MPSPESRPSDPHLPAGLRLLARYCLIGAMLSFGIRNLLRPEGGGAGPLELILPLGDVTPSQFLALWLRAAAPFQIAAGLAEVAAGLLLLFPPTLLSGAGLAFAVLLNSLMLDLCFHTGVAAADIALLIVAGGLTTPGCRVFLNVFLLNRHSTLHHDRPAWPVAFDKNANRLLRFLLAAWVAYDCAALLRLKSDRAFHSQLYGAYRVETMAVNGRRLPLGADSECWQMLAVDKSGAELEIRTAGGDIIEMDAVPVLKPAGSGSDEARRAAERTQGRHGTLKLRRFGSPPSTHASSLTYDLPAPGVLVLTGDLDGGALSVRASRMNNDAFPFLNSKVWAFPF